MNIEKLGIHSCMSNDKRYSFDTYHRTGKCVEDSYKCVRQLSFKSMVVA